MRSEGLILSLFGILGDGSPVVPGGEATAVVMVVVGGVTVAEFKGEGGDSRKSESERLQTGKAASISVASVAACVTR